MKFWSSDEIQGLEIDKNAFSSSGEVDGFWCLILCRCWGFSRGGLNVNNNWNDNNNGVAAAWKFCRLVPIRF
jgi:hypothetical protein